MYKFLALSDKWLSRLEYALVVGAALAIFVMMIVTSIDVLMRYAFNAPLSWVFDLIVHYLLKASFLLGFAWCLSIGHHICVDFFARFIPEGVYHLFQCVGAIAGAALFSIAAWHGWHETVTAWQASDIFFGVVPWPAWPSHAIVPLGLLPMALRCLHLGFVNAVAALDPTSKNLLPLLTNHGWEEERL